MVLEVIAVTMVVHAVTVLSAASIFKVGWLKCCFTSTETLGLTTVIIYFINPSGINKVYC